MQVDYPWSALELDGPQDERTIRRSYARLAKLTRPDTDPEGFQALRAAYEEALRRASHPDEQRARMLAPDDLREGIAAVESAVNGPELLVVAPLSEHVEPDERASPLPVGVNAGDVDQAMAQDEQAWREMVDRIIMTEAASGEHADLAQWVRGLIALPANQNLELARRTEEFLLQQAAFSESWPPEVITLVWDHYGVRDRVAFLPPWSAEARIQQRLDSHDWWDALRERTRRAPYRPEAMLFRRLRWHDRLRFMFSYGVRAQIQDTLRSIRAQHPERIGELDGASLEWMDKVVARLERLPQWGFAGWLFVLVAMSFAAEFSLPQGDRAHDPVRAVALWAGLAVMAWAMAAWCKRKVLHHWRKADAARPRAFAVVEAACVGVVAGCYAIGGQSPLLATMVAMAAGVILLLCWTTHQRLWLPGLGLGGRPLGGVIIVMLTSVMVQSAMAYKSCLAIAPLAGALGLQRIWPAPPWILDRAEGRYHWRSGQAFITSARSMHALAGTALVLYASVTLGPAFGMAWLQPFTASPTWAVVGVLLLCMVWQLIGVPAIPYILTKSGLGSGLLLIGSGFAVLSLLTWLSDGLQLGWAATFRLVFAALLLGRLLALNWRIRQLQSSREL